MRKVLVVIAVFLAANACGGDDDSPVLTQPPADDITTTSEPDADATGSITAEGDCQDATKAEGQADLEMQDFVFAPPCLVISTSQGLRVHNEGKVEHNWTVEGFGLDIDVAPGDENNTEATGLEPGEYTFFCKYHRDTKGMQGKLRVKGDG